MNLIYINKYGIYYDIKHHIRHNRFFYIIGVVLFLICMGLGLRTGLAVLNPYSALKYYNLDYYNLVNAMGRDKYILGFVLLNVISFFFLFVLMQHYFVTPLCIIVLVQRVFNFGVTLALVFRIFNFAAIFVTVLALIPFFIILFVMLLSFSVYMYRVAQYCYRYESSSFVIFSMRSMWRRLVFYFVLVIVVSIIGGGITMLLSGSVI